VKQNNPNEGTREFKMNELLLSFLVKQLFSMLYKIKYHVFYEEKWKKVQENLNIILYLCMADLFD